MTECKYRKDSVAYALCTCDWSDLNINQIAEVLDVLPQQVHSEMSRIKKETGYVVPYVKLPAGPKKDK